MFETLLPKVLVVDDEAPVCEFLKVAIAPKASSVAVAENAATALEAIERGNFDIILCDIFMPGRSGLELLSLARQSKWDVAFILTTGRVHVNQIIEALHLGASDFLLKPFTLETLDQSISRAFRLLQRERESRAYRTSLEASIERRTRDLMRALHEVEENYQIPNHSALAANRFLPAILSAYAWGGCVCGSHDVASAAETRGLDAPAA